MNEWNIHQKDLQDAHPPSAGRSRRVAFCPTCNRPFLRGTGVRQDPGKRGYSAPVSPPVPDQPSSPPLTPEPLTPEEKEYCREECLPGSVV